MAGGSCPQSFSMHSQNAIFAFVLELSKEGTRKLHVCNCLVLHIWELKNNLHCQGHVVMMGHNILNHGPWLWCWSIYNCLYSDIHEAIIHIYGQFTSVETFRVCFWITRACLMDADTAGIVWRWAFTRIARTRWHTLVFWYASCKAIRDRRLAVFDQLLGEIASGNSTHQTAEARCSLEAMESHFIFTLGLMYDILGRTNALPVGCNQPP